MNKDNINLEFKRAEFAAALKNYYTHRGMTQAEFADRLGCSASWVGALMSDDPKVIKRASKPNLQIYANACRILRVSLNTFFKH